MYKKIKRFYDMGLYTAAQVHDFVDKGVITAAEYREICESNDGASSGRMKTIDFKRRNNNEN